MGEISMGDIVGLSLAVILTVGIIAKFVWLAYISLFKPEEIPEDIDGPVSGWGTPDG
jgi:hypothetical protein